MTYAGAAYGDRPYFGVAPLPTPARIPTGYEAVVMADGPQGYWRLGEAVSNEARALDVSGNARTGTYTVAGSNAATVTGLLPGDADTAVSFAGGYMRVPGDTAMETSQFLTVEAIIQPSAASLVGNQPIASRWVSGQSQRWLLWLSGGKVQGLVYSGANGTATGTTTLVAGQTYHVALTYDGFTIRVYLNGVLDGSASFTNGILTNVGTPFLDVARSSDTTAGTVTVDEVAFYTKTLTQQRLAAHYTAAVTVPTVTGTVAASLPRSGAALSGTSTPPPPVTGTLAGSLQPVAATLAGTSLPPGVAGLLAATLPSFSATLAGTFTTGALQVTLPTFTAALAGTSTPPPVTGTVAATLAPFSVALQGDAEQFGAKLTLALPAFTISLQAANRITATDTTYANDSYTYGGTADVDYAPPVAPPPPGLVRLNVRRVHQSLPTPDLVRGRPQ